MSFKNRSHRFAPARSARFPVAGLLVRASLLRAGVENSPVQIAPLLQGLGGLAALPVPSVVAEASACATRSRQRSSTTR